MQSDEITNNPAESTIKIETKGPPKACLFVASLDDYTNEEEIRHLFGKYGEILKIKLLKDQVSRPYAFVQFSNEEDADLAIENTRGMTIGDRKLRVERARVNRTLFVAKISKQMQGSQLKEIAEQYGEVESVTIIKNHHTNRSKGCGFIKFSYREDAALALSELKETQCKWVVEWATSNNDPESLRIDKSNIFVGSLNPQEITEDLLRDRFGLYGPVESVTLINKAENSVDASFIPTAAASASASFPPLQAHQGVAHSAAPTPSPSTPPPSFPPPVADSSNDDASTPKQRTAFAFIRYNDPEHSAAAIEKENGVDWLGHKLRVQYCETKEAKNKRRAKHKQFIYPGPTAYYPAVPMMYMDQNMHDMQNMYNSYYPIYYNGAPWMYPPVDQQMMPNMPPQAYNPEDNIFQGNMNMAPQGGPSSIPWLQ